MCEGQTTFGTQFFLSTMRVPGLYSGCLGLASKYLYPLSISPISKSLMCKL